MKTNIVMNSKHDRNLFGVIIRQETKSEMLSLTDLQEAYTHARVLNGWAEKSKIQDLITQKENTERIYYLLKEQSFINSDFSEFMEKVKKIGIIKVLKEIGVYKTTGRGTTKATFCNPYIWVLIAMELNPMLYAKVIKWLTDKLICNRIDACDLNNSLRGVIHAKINNPNYAEINKALNVKIFGFHETGMRNLASEKELAVLNKLQENIAFCIQRGFLKTNEEIINEINRVGV